MITYFTNEKTLLIKLLLMITVFFGGAKPLAKVLRSYSTKDIKSNVLHSFIHPIPGFEPTSFPLAKSSGSNHVVWHVPYENPNEGILYHSHGGTTSRGEDIDSIYVYI